MASTRRNYSLQFKLDAIQYANATSTSKAAEHFGIHIGLIKRWKSRKEDMEGKINKADRNLHDKRLRKSKWPDLEDYLAEWTESRRQQGHKVTGSEILREAREKAIELNYHDFKGSSHWIYRLMQRNSIKPTLVQKLPENWENAYTNFINFVSDHKIQYTLDHIGSMDEIPVNFDLPFDPNVNQNSSDVRNTVTDEKFFFTVILCVTANANKLPPYVIFRCKSLPNGNYPLNIIVSASDKSCVTPTEVILWHEKVWMKRKNSIFHRKSMLMIDSAPAHRSEEVKSRFQKNSTLIAMIPDGLTKKLQVLDISVKKSFKLRLKKKWEKWISRCYKINAKSGFMKLASYEDICQLIVEAWEEVPENTIKNAFKRTTIDFYDDGIIHYESETEELYLEDSDEEHQQHQEQEYVDVFLKVEALDDEDVIEEEIE